MITKLLTLAETTGGGFDGMTISVAAIAALGTAIAVAVKAFKAGKEEGRKTTSVVEPNPLPVSLASQLATKEELKEVETRLVGEMKKLENNQSGERTVARNANSNIHARLDKMAEKSDLLRIHERIDMQTVATASTTASLNEVKANVGKLLDIALKLKPGPRQ